MDKGCEEGPEAGGIRLNPADDSSALMSGRTKGDAVAPDSENREPHAPADSSTVATPEYHRDVRGEGEVVEVRAPGDMSAALGRPAYQASDGLSSLQEKRRGPYVRT